MAARVLMFQGTGSDVGKSLVVAGLCRLLANRGHSVRPFKPQNMSNNAAVTADGGEIGRAQALQARAARVASSVDMNPVLLKPQSEVGSQIVVQGRVFGTARAKLARSKLIAMSSYSRVAFAGSLFFIGIAYFISQTVDIFNCFQYRQNCDTCKLKVFEFSSEST